MAIPGKYKVGKISSWEYLSGNLGKQMEPREGVGLYSSIKYWLVQVYDTQFHNWRRKCQLLLGVVGLQG